MIMESTFIDKNILLHGPDLGRPESFIWIIFHHPISTEEGCGGMLISVEEGGGVGQEGEDKNG